MLRSLVTQAQSPHLRSKAPAFSFSSTRWANGTAKFVSTAVQHKSKAQPIRSIIPECPPATTLDCEPLYKFIEDSKKLVVFTGAGVSTESGIPDHRGPDGAYHSGTPKTHQEIFNTIQTQRRFWIRSYIGWKEFSSRKPGPSHIALAQLEKTGRVLGIITQNVDGLHHKAGSNAIELHGTTYKAVCQSCHDRVDRDVVQERIKLMNREWAEAVEERNKRIILRQRPDGDVEGDHRLFEYSGFQVPVCEHCGGNMKPDVVFFGEGVPPEKHRAAQELVQSSDAFLIAGSSIMLLSPFRLAKCARENHIPIAILNAGETRVDNLAALKINRLCGEVLSKILTMGLNNNTA